ncbi:hypothetical protein Taro_003863 [Colocasia esculenta]|uniref:Uncharacterized protein n=1 Tax=Colocasia esculenta TaxID=4460 RepID=A0A843TQ29_COLES|nr:hypothetical protein [Colocasia esculenta]
MWTFRVAVVSSGIGVDANLRILQVLKGAWRTVERVALPNYARKRRSVVQFPWELAKGSVCLTCSRGAAVGPFVRDCEAKRLFLCCVVRVGYWPDQLVVRSRVVALFFLTRAMLAPVVVREFVTRGRGLTSSRCALVLAQLWLSCGLCDLPVEVLLVMLCLSEGIIYLWFSMVFITYLYPCSGVCVVVPQSSRYLFPSWVTL